MVDIKKEEDDVAMKIFCDRRIGRSMYIQEREKIIVYILLLTFKSLERIDCVSTGRFCFSFRKKLRSSTLTLKT